MDYTKHKIDGESIILSNVLRAKLLLRYPLSKIPKFKDYSEKIQLYCIKNNRLPFFLEFDIDTDGIAELVIVMITRIGGFGDIIIVSKNGDIRKIKWRRPMNALYFDYLIEEANPKKYTKFGLYDSNRNIFEIPVSHLVTKGYLNRVLYWNGTTYKQDRITNLI